MWGINLKILGILAICHLGNRRPQFTALFGLVTRRISTSVKSFDSARMCHRLSPNFTHSFGGKLDHILSYPKYYPSKANLRAYLLVYDRVSTIVPFTDQERVIRHNEAYAELADALPDQTLTFFDPSSSGSGNWTRKETVEDFFGGLINDVLFDEPTAALALAVKELKTHGTSKKRAEVVARLEGNHWVYMSAEKLTHDFEAILLEAGLALKVPENNLTLVPLLVHPRISDHLMARLARDIAVQERISPVASTAAHLAHALIDEELESQEKRAQLMAMTLDVAIPDDLTDLSVARVLELRDSFADVRRKLPAMAQAFVTNLNLDSERDAKQFRERLNDHRSETEQMILTAQKNAEWRGRTRFAIDIVAAALGGGAAAAAGGLGTVVQGMLAGAVGVVAAQPGAKLSTRLFPTDQDYVEQMASLRSGVLSEIETHARHQRQYDLWTRSQ